MSLQSAYFSLTQDFISELKKASNHIPSSLMHIEHAIHGHLDTSPSPVQAMIIGGSNFESALVKNTSGKISISVKKKSNKNPIHNNVMFFNLIIPEILPETKFLALNFAYPLEPVSRGQILDGKLIQRTKLDAFEGLVGKVVGELIEKEVQKSLGKAIQVSVANDTICLLLAGLTKFPKDSLAAAIVGTGYNMAYFSDDGDAINLEAANFDKFEKSEYGMIIDQNSLNPGKALFEKEISGAYLFEHFNLSEGISGRITSTEDLHEIAKNENHPDCQIARRLFQRSAKLVATHIAGLTRFKKHDMHFIMQGSLFWKAWNYKHMVEEAVGKLCPEYKVDYFEVENDGIIGAAKLFL